jgi:hypothetical protein
MASDDLLEECGIEELYPEYKQAERTAMTTMSERFTIDCSYCGFLTAVRTFREALEAARRLKGTHASSEEKITIFDRLAQRGVCNMWDVEGNCIHQKQYYKVPPSAY